MNRNSLLVLGGALLGGLIGAAVFAWLVRSFGAYGFAIPGVAVGLGASFHRGAPRWVAALCGGIGLAAGVLATWKTLAPFPADDSLGHFVSHLHRLPPVSLVLLLLGGGVAFWLPFRRAAT